MIQVYSPLFLLKCRILLMSEGAPLMQGGKIFRYTMKSCNQHVDYTVAIRFHHRTEWIFKFDSSMPKASIHILRARRQ